MSGPRQRVLATVLGLLAVSGFAQPPASRRGPEGRSRAREEVNRMVDAYVVSQLQEGVGLTDEQFVKALPLVKRYLGERRDAAERRRDALREMQRMLRSGSATEARMAESLRQVKALEAEEADKARRNLEALDAVLLPLQQAKFRVMQLEVEQRIREIMQQARQSRRRGDPGADPEP